MPAYDGIHLNNAKGPDGVRLFAIGDVHGRLDLLKGMHEAIAANIARDRVADWRIIHLGDYVDRGPDSKGVLDFLLSRMLSESRIEILAGNHDLGFLDYLDDPNPNALFSRFGGDATAYSYGVDGDFSDPSSLMRNHAALSRAVPSGHRRLLEGLGYSVAFGDYFFCHAGIRPGVPLQEQRPDDLVWIRYDFLDDLRLHPKVIVHGHTPQEKPEVRPNRVNVDTRAYESGRLTALVIDGDRKRTISVQI